MKILYFDCKNGISGDMLLKALMELGDCKAQVEQAMSAAGLEENGAGHTEDLNHHHGRSYETVRQLITCSRFSAKAKETALRIYSHIAEAEAKVHGKTLETVHFHEVGRDQAIRNALGIGMALEAIAPDQIYTSELYDGKGTVLCSHGEIPVPVPAVQALMQRCRYVFRTADADTEMVTPSGLAGLMGIGAEASPKTLDAFRQSAVILAETEAKGSRDTGRGGLKGYLLEPMNIEDEERKSKMEKNLAKTYQPKDFEDRIYEMWEQSGAFRAERDPEKKPFTIVMPPPNITGQLHMGHALDQTLQDVLTRFKRLQGYSALWLPGSDHASIATEVKVVDRIRQEEGLEKEDLGREEFLKRAWAWKEEFGGKITKQCRKLGDSCDWSRERFTMDEGCNKAVNHFFVKLYEKGLIYRGNRLINWCPECGTSLSDAEVEHEDKNGMYWYFRYPAADGGEGVVVATSRPETMFADVAIAVHPEDDRYKDLVGKTVVLPLVGKEIPVIADTYPDPEKGTGAVKITPAHDPNDFEVGAEHGLGTPVCIDFEAKMTAAAGKYEGMDRYECRKAWVKDLEEAGYLVKTEEKVIPAGGCYRCNTVVEPMLSDQWFVKMEDLAKPAIEAAKKGDLVHVPERFEKIYLHWLEEIRDWCISRQLWWGHRIPAYYCQACGEIIVAEETPAACHKCGSASLKQDEDVLDTWFSSALWPFSTLGWPKETEDFKYFYPTDVLVTGYDIIFFWVVRMVFSALETTGESPFRYVYVHGLVRDAQGRKMSKSLGNGIDPLEIIDQYGADALRFMLTTGITPGNDMRFKTDRLESARNFANKLWNASRFVIMNLQDEAGNFKPMADLGAAALQDEDKWILSRVNAAVKYITDAMEKFDLALAGQRAYDLIWNEYCDWYIEIVKGRLYGDDEEDKKVARAVLVKALKDMLRLLHPFMPYITEEIWTYLPETDRFLIKENWPVYDEALTFAEEAEKLEMAMAIIRSIRNIRAEADASPGKKLRAVILTAEGREDVAKAGERYIRKLANITEITFITGKEQVPDEVMSAVVDGAEVFIPLDDIMDYEAELDRLTKEKKKLEGEVKRVKGKLSNEGFLSKAPEKVINEERAKQIKYEEMLAKVTDRLAIVEKKV